MIYICNEDITSLLYALLCPVEVSKRAEEAEADTPGLEVNKDREFFNSTQKMNV